MTGVNFRYEKYMNGSCFSLEPENNIDNNEAKPLDPSPTIQTSIQDPTSNKSHGGEEVQTPYTPPHLTVSCLCQRTGSDIFPFKSIFVYQQ